MTGGGSSRTSVHNNGGGHSSRTNIGIRRRHALQLFKTDLCKFYLQSRCENGDSCSYAHTMNEVRRKPDLTRTSMCRSVLQKGHCDDPSCRFAHTDEQLRATHGFFKMKMCGFAESGRCKHGANCRFAHTVEELRPPRPPPPDAEDDLRKVTFKAPTEDDLSTATSRTSVPKVAPQSQSPQQRSDSGYIFGMRNLGQDSMTDTGGERGTDSASHATQQPPPPPVPSREVQDALVLQRQTKRRLSGPKKDAPFIPVLNSEAVDQAAREQHQTENSGTTTSTTSSNEARPQNAAFVTPGPDSDASESWTSGNSGPSEMPRSSEHTRSPVTTSDSGAGSTSGAAGQATYDGSQATYDGSSGDGGTGSTAAGSNDTQPGRQREKVRHERPRTGHVNQEPRTPAAAKSTSTTTSLNSLMSRSLPEIDTSSQNGTKKTEGVTTLLITNVPTFLTQGALLCLFEDLMVSMRSKFDFFYCPWDEKAFRNLGYALINFPVPADASCFRERWGGKEICPGSRGTKPLRIIEAAVQGRQANLDHFSKVEIAHCSEWRFRPMLRDEQGSLQPLIPSGGMPGTGDTGEATSPPDDVANLADYTLNAMNATAAVSAPLTAANDAGFFSSASAAGGGGGGARSSSDSATESAQGGIGSASEIVRKDGNPRRARHGPVKDLNRNNQGHRKQQPPPPRFTPQQQAGMQCYWNQIPQDAMSAQVAPAWSSNWQADLAAMQATQAQGQANRMPPQRVAPSQRGEFVGGPDAHYQQQYPQQLAAMAPQYPCIFMMPQGGAAYPNRGVYSDMQNRGGYSYAGRGMYGEAMPQSLGLPTYPGGWLSDEVYTD